MKRRILSMILAGVLVLQSSSGVFAEELITEGENGYIETLSDETAETLITVDADDDSCMEDLESTFSEIEGSAASDEMTNTGVSDTTDHEAESLSAMNSNTDEQSQNETAATFIIEDVMEVDTPEQLDVGTSSTNNDCGENVWYSINGTVLTISGNGAMYDYQNTTYVPYISSNSNITQIIVEEGVTRIGNYAFSAMGSASSGYVSISLPSTLEEIGDYAFYNSRVSEITLPDGLKAIGDYAFYNDGLTEITIPNSVTSIGKSAFGSCNSLTTVTLSESITEIPGGLFGYCSSLLEVNIPDSVTKVGNGAFKGCIKLSRISFPEHITEIGSQVFEQCTGLTYVDLPDAITTIPEGTFQSCTNLTSITIPEGVISIGKSAFNYCTSLTELIIPASVTTMGSDTFNGCNNLTSIYFLGDVPENLNTDTQFDNVISEVTLYYLPDANGWYNLDTSAMGKNKITVTSYETASFGENDALNWSLSSSGVLTISGNGAIPDYNSYSDVPWYKMHNNIKEVIIDAGVTEVGKYAFFDCSNLKTVSLPSTLTRIGQGGFFDCESLQSIEIPDSVTELGIQAFGWSGLTSVTIPDSVKTVEVYCFECCPSLERVVWGKGCTAIEEGMFWYCSKLEEVKLPNNLEKIDWGVFQNCKSLQSIEIPSSVTEIGDSAFNCCSSLKDITFPEGITKIDDYMFGGCFALTSFTIPENVTYIGECAFGGTGLTEITIPEKVTEIGAGAFRICTSLNSITFKGALPITSTVQWEGTSFELTEAYTFKDVTATVYYPLGKTGWTGSIPVDFGGTLTMIPYGSASGTCGDNLNWILTEEGVLTIFGTGAMYDFNEDLNGPWYVDYSEKIAINKVVIQDGVTSIGAYAFSDCENLTTVEIPDSVTSIGDLAFLECVNLTQAALPDQLTTIGENAFNGCNKLTQVTLPDQITAIGKYAFYGCGISSIIIPASVQTIGSSAFQNSLLTEVLFLGNYPSIGDYAFAVNTESICITYPENDDTWSGKGDIGHFGKIGSDCPLRNITIGVHVHNWTTVNSKAATCTTEGSITKTCTSCGKTTTDYTAKLGHQYNGEETKKATCTATGVKTYTCSRSGCSDSYTEPIAKISHTISSAWTTTKAATCSATGTQVKKCTKCGTVMKTQSIAAKGHSWSEWVETAAATVFEPKHEQCTCSTCKTTVSRCTGSALTPKIELNYTNIPLQVGQSTTKVVVSKMANGDYIKSWKSSNTSIVKVNATSGKITAQKKTGTAKVTVTLASGITANLTVKVQKNAVKTTGISIVGYTKYTVNKGKKLDLAATMQPTVYPITSLQGITYSSSNTKVATVNSKGVVTAKRAGTAKITMKSGSIKDVVTITVPKTKTTAITGVPTSLSLKKGKTYTLKVKVQPSNSDYAVTYKTSNKKVASITSKGKIKGVKVGTATITVTSGSVKKTFKVKVK